MLLSYPLFIDLPRKKGKPKRVYSSLNVFRNLNHFTANECKHMYKDICWKQLHAMPTQRLNSPCEVTVTLYAPDARDRDLGNFCTMIQKYSDDAVVEFGLLKDDSIKFIKRVIYEWGGVDRTNPRIDVHYQDEVKSG